MADYLYVQKGIEIYKYVSIMELEVLWKFKKN
jgi:hypothetical protein